MVFDRLRRKWRKTLARSQNQVFLMVFDRLHGSEVAVHGSEVAVHGSEASIPQGFCMICEK